MMYSLRNVVVGVVVCTAAAGVAAAGPLSKPTNAEARAHLERAIRLYNTRSFEEAITELKAGALLEPAPVFDYNLGQANRQLGRYEDALWHYQRFLANGQPTGELLDAVNGFIGEMKAHLQDRARTMPPNGPGEAPEATSPAPAAPVAAQSPIRPDATKINEGRGPNWLGWGLTVGGVAAMGTGGGLLISAQHLNDDANGTLDAKARQNLRDRSSTRNTAGLIVGAAGIALTAAGVIDLLIVHSHHNSGSSAAFDIGIGSQSIFVLGRF